MPNNQIPVTEKPPEVIIRVCKELDPWLARVRAGEVRLVSIECGRPSSGWKLKLRLDWPAVAA